MNKKKLWAALLAAVLLISAATVTVLALAGKKPEAQSGEYYRKTVDRMEMPGAVGLAEEADAL